MNKRTTNQAAYTMEEINEFLERITDQVEALVLDLNIKNKELTKKDKEIAARDEKIHRLAMEMDELQRRIKHYEDIEDELSKTKQLAIEETRKIEIKKEKLIVEAKKNADRIVNEALLTAEKTEMEANLLRKNIKQVKDKMKKATKI